MPALEDRHTATLELQLRFAGSLGRRGGNALLGVRKRHSASFLTEPFHLRLRHLTRDIRCQLRLRILEAGLLSPCLPDLDRLQRLKLFKPGCL